MVVVLTQSLNTTDRAQCRLTLNAFTTDKQALYTAIVSVQSTNNADVATKALSLADLYRAFTWDLRPKYMYVWCCAAVTK